MQLRIRAQLSKNARAAIERRVRLNLGRRAAGIDRALVTLESVRNGGPVHRCRIRVRLQQGQRFTIEDHAEDPLTAAGAAALRLEHRLDRLRAAQAASPLPGGSARLF